MEFEDRVEYYKRQFPHWLDKNPYSVFSRLIKVLVNQESDKLHKIRSLDYAKRINKPLQIWKTQENPYEYDLNFRVMMDRLKTVNVYINPTVNDREEISNYEKCLTKSFTDDGYNSSFMGVFHGDTRRQYTDNETIQWDDYSANENSSYDKREFYETIFHHNGDGYDETDFTKPNTFIYNTATTSVTPTENGVKVCNGNSGATRLYWVNISENTSLSNYYQIEPPFIAEGEIVSSEGVGKCSIATRSKSSTYSKTFNDLGIHNGGKFKVICYLDKIEYYANGVLKYTKNGGVGDKMSLMFYIPVDTCFIYKNITIKKPVDAPVIPNDTFILEAITYDDYRWIKGYPENDNNELYSIYHEKSSYTDYLTFKIKKSNIKKVEILCDDEVVFEKELYKTVSSANDNGEIIYHDYQTQKKIQDYNGIMVSDVDDDDYKFQLILNNEDFNEDGTLKHNYDLRVYIYDKNNPSCKERETIITKRYNGYEKTNYDCFSHDLSLDMLGHYWNVPRLQFKTKDPSYNLHEYYSQTFPPYNNRATEDDYTYQNRLKHYIYEYNKEYFPILELWKNYHIIGTLFNRKDLLSRMDKSYICEEVDYFIDNTEAVNTENKLTVVNGKSNPISINGHEWEESVILNNLFVVPETTYSLKYTLELPSPLSEENKPTYHLYYFDKKGNCHHEEKIEPTLEGTSANTFSINETFKTVPNACKLDIVLEYDYPFSYTNANLSRQKIIDKTPMYMTTKEDYNSCVYELQAKYQDIPTNIDFTNNNQFEKLLNRSLPLSHKGYLKVDMDNREQNATIKEACKWNVVEIFGAGYDSGTSSYDSESEEYIYKTELAHFINGGDRWKLEVTLSQDRINPSCNQQTEDLYIRPNIWFKETSEEEWNTDNMIALDNVEANYKTRVIHYFTIPDEMNILKLTFESNNQFKYEKLSLKKVIDGEEISWETLA